MSDHKGARSGKVADLSTGQFDGDVGCSGGSGQRRGSGQTSRAAADSVPRIAFLGGEADGQSAFAERFASLDNVER